MEKSLYSFTAPGNANQHNLYQEKFAVFNKTTRAESVITCLGTYLKGTFLTVKRKNRNHIIIHCGIICNGKILENLSKLNTVWYSHTMGYYAIIFKKETDFYELIRSYSQGSYLSLFTKGMQEKQNLLTC